MMQPQQHVQQNKAEFTAMQIKNLKLALHKQYWKKNNARSSHFLKSPRIPLEVA